MRCCMSGNAVASCSSTTRAESGLPADHAALQRYQYAQNHNHFGTVPNGPDNWIDLLAAYRYAGVNVGPEMKQWIDYLRILGSQDSLYIYDIAQARYAALNNSQRINTTTHALNTV